MKDSAATITNPLLCYRAYHALILVCLVSAFINTSSWRSEAGAVQEVLLLAVCWRAKSVMCMLISAK